MLPAALVKADSSIEVAGISERHGVLAQGGHRWRERLDRDGAIKE
jgi:hypothetical protein